MPFDCAFLAVPAQVHGKPPNNRSIKKNTELKSQDGTQGRVFADVRGKEIYPEDQWRIDGEQS